MNLDESMTKLRESVADVRKSIDESYELRQFDWELSNVLCQVDSAINHLEWWIKRTETYLNYSKE